MRIRRHRIADERPQIRRNLRHKFHVETVSCVETRLDDCIERNEGLITVCYPVLYPFFTMPHPRNIQRICSFSGMKKQHSQFATAPQKIYYIFTTILEKLIKNTADQYRARASFAEDFYWRQPIIAIGPVFNVDQSRSTQDREEPHAANVLTQYWANEKQDQERCC